MGTGANMIVKNQTNAPITTTLSNLSCMYQDGDDGSELQVFNNLTLNPYASSNMTYVEADGNFFGGCSETQSHFQINYLGGSLGLDLGTAPLFDTAVTLNSNPAQIQAVLAPNAPVAPGVSYTFYLYGGPAVLTPLVNSVINANLPALTAAISSSSPLTLGFVSITGLSFSTLSCPYAAVVPDGQNQLSFTVILNATGTLNVSLSAASQLASGSLSVTDLVILIEGTIIFSEEPTVTVTLFACSLGSYSISQAILGLLEILFPAVAILKQFATAPDLAGLINVNFNQPIVQAINNALKKLSV